MHYTISHQEIDRRSLALDMATARMLRLRPELLDRVKATLERWIEQRQPDVPKALLEWRQILTGSLDEIVTFITRQDEEATRLRQSSPFCILPADERQRIFKEYEAQRAGTYH